MKTDITVLLIWNVIITIFAVYFFITIQDLRGKQDEIEEIKESLAKTESVVWENRDYIIDQHDRLNKFGESLTEFPDLLVESMEGFSEIYGDSMIEFAGAVDEEFERHRVVINQLVEINNKKAASGGDVLSDIEKLQLLLSLMP